jgi:hypothetical protein
VKVKKKKPGAAFPVAASPTLKADATDPVSGRRQFRLLVLAVESKIRQLAKLLPEVDFDAIARGD